MSALEALPRPMSVGELLDRAITLYRRNFLTLVGIAAIVNAPLLIVHVIAAVLRIPTDFTTLSQRSSTASLNTSFLTDALIVVAVSIPVAIAWVFQNGALAVVASEFFLGRTIGIKAAYGRAWHRGGALLGAAILIGLLYLVIFGALLVPLFGMILGSVSSSSNQSAAFAILVLFLCFCAALLPAFVLFLILNIHWIFFPQAIVLENNGARAGLGRSWRLVRGSFWRVFFTSLIMGLFISAITVTPSWVVSFGALALTASPVVVSVANNTVEIVINIFVVPIQYAIWTLLYYDLRIRKEGFDLEMQAQQIAETAV